MNDLDFDEAVREAQAVVAAGNSRRPQLRLVGLEERIFTVSRERKARFMDALAVILLFLLMGALGAATLLLVAPKAKADIDPTAVSFAAHYADAICGTLATYPTNDGLQGVLVAIQDQGLTNLQAAGAVVLAVTDVCPQQTYILERFADRWGAIEEKTV
jgi:hypothetical protein